MEKNNAHAKDLWPFGLVCVCEKTSSTPLNAHMTNISDLLTPFLDGCKRSSGVREA